MTSQRNYFVYVPDSRLCSAWGCAATSAGYTEIPPGSPYPPARHPDDHHFEWKRGRILRAFQVIYISEGRGHLEFGPNRAGVEIREGDVFVLFPNVWHRYAPDPETGWTEHWVECRGNAYEFMREGGLLDPDRPLHRGIDRVGELFDRIHALARDDMLVNQPTVSTLGLVILAAICQQRNLPEDGAARLVDRARMLLLKRCAEPLSVEALAAELGVSYSYFRRIFKLETGTSPKQYVMSARIQRACDLLDNTDKSIKEIAGLLGFNSAFHFSAQFSDMLGRSPTRWRVDKQ